MVRNRIPKVFCSAEQPEFRRNKPIVPFIPSSAENFFLPTLVTPELRPNIFNDMRIWIQTFLKNRILYLRLKQQRKIKKTVHLCGQHVGCTLVITRRVLEDFSAQLSNSFLQALVLPQARAQEYSEQQAVSKHDKIGMKQDNQGR